MNFLVLKKRYREIGILLWSNRMLIIMALLVFSEMIVFHILNGEASLQYWEYVENTESQYTGLFWFILIENLKSTIRVILVGFVPMFLGCTLACYMSVLSVISTFRSIIKFIPLKIVLLSIAPHGLFEIPMIVFTMILSTIISKETTLFIWKKITKRNISIWGRDVNTLGLRKTVKLVVYSWIMIVLPAMFIAAMVETRLSPLFLEWLL